MISLNFADKNELISVIEQAMRQYENDRICRRLRYCRPMKEFEFVAEYLLEHSCLLFGSGRGQGKFITSLLGSENHKSEEDEDQ